jgi:hypothetical protein
MARPEVGTSSQQELIEEALGLGATVEEVNQVLLNTGKSEADAAAIMADINLQQNAATGQQVPVGQDLVANITAPEDIPALTQAPGTGTALAGSMESMLVTAPNLAPPATPIANTTPQQTLEKGEIANEIAAQQQAIITGVPSITMPTATEPAKLATVPMVGVEGGAVPADLQDAMDRSKALTERISGQLEALQVAPEDVKALAETYDTATNAKQVLALQAETEGLRIQTKLQEVTGGVNSQAHQTELMNRQQQQAADMQATAEGIEADAEEGGFGYLLKSMLNQEIYGNAAGRAGIQLQSETMQYNATVKEIADNTASTQSMATANLATADIHTKGTISANQDLIAAVGQQEKHDAILDANQSNAANLRTMMSVRTAEARNIIAMYDMQSRAASRAFQEKKFTWTQNRALIDDGLRRTQARIALITEQQVQLDLDISREGKSDALETRKVALARNKVGLQNDLIGLTLNDATLQDKMIISKNAAEASVVNLALAKNQLKENTDLNKQAALQANYAAAATAAERASMEFEEWKGRADFRAQQQAMTELSTAQQTLIQGHALETLDMTEPEKRANALLQFSENAKKVREDAAAEEEAIAAVQNFESFIYGDKRSSGETITAQLANGNMLYQQMRQNGAVRGPNDEFVLGTDFAIANRTLAFYESNGVVNPDVKAVRVLHDIRALQQKLWASNPEQKPDSNDELGIAVQFNQLGKGYLAAKNNEIIFNDVTNPMAPPTLPQLITTSSNWAKQPLSKFLDAQGQVDTNIKQIVNKGLAGIESGAITSEELIEGIETLGNTIFLNNAGKYGGMEVLGQSNSTAINMQVDKPRGMIGSVFNSLADNLEGPLLPVAAALVTAGVIIATAPVTVPLITGGGVALAGVTTTSAVTAAGAGTLTGASVAGYGMGQLTSAVTNSGMGAVDTMTLDINNTEAVRQYVIAARSSTTLGGISTDDIQAGAQ